MPETIERPETIIRHNNVAVQKQIQAQYKMAYDNAWAQSGNDAATYNKQLQQIDFKFSKIASEQTFKTNQQMQQIQRIDSYIKAGHVSPEAGDEAKWRMVMPTSLAKSRRQKPVDSGTPYSASQLKETGSLSQAITEFASSAKDTLATTTGWGALRPNVKSQASLMDQYMKFRDYMQYDALDVSKQKQIDLSWDAEMRDDAYKNWWVNKEKTETFADVRAARSKGTYAKLMRRKFGVESRRVTNFAKSIRKTIPVEKPVQGVAGGKPISDAQITQYIQKYGDGAEEAIKRDGYKLD